MSLKGSPIRRLELFNRDATTEATALNVQIDRLNSVIHGKNIEIKQLLDENKLIKLNYEEQIASFQKTISLLEGQLKEVQKSRQAEFVVIKEKYDKITAEETENLKSYHSHEMEFLLKQIAHLRVDAQTKQQKLLLKDKQFSNMKESFERQIEEKMTQINNLNRNLLAIEEYKNKEIKELSSKRELERSRTSGIVSSRKENNQFMDKQLRKVNEEVLEKAIKIQNLNRELTKTKKKADQSERIYSKKIEDLLRQRDEEAREREEHFAKIEKALKDELLEFKSNELKLLGELDRQKDQMEILKADIKRGEEAIQSKEEDIRGYKEMLERQREQHAKEIANLMKQRRKKSSSRLGSSRSLNSSIRGEGHEDLPMTPVPLKHADSARLPTVRQETPDRSPNHSLEKSGITEEHGEAEEEDNELAKAIFHYDALIEELKRSHSSQIELLKHKINKASKNLEEKQQQLLDILTRFSPLVKIHAEEKSIQEDRKERIERHWKADLALLEIILKKYKIRAFE